ncbi:MAG TPA: hypothetical protein VM737_04915 [Gemmatimonadota bacterium]|nr:hypothetical protein [Gemmatimonadota bacterium]
MSAADARPASGPPAAPLLAALAILSAAILAYEVVLVHLLSIAHWSHFAALVISLALLGFGTSGSLLAVLGPALAGRERAAFRWAVLGAALAFDPAYRLAAAIPFDAFELLAIPRQILYLSLTYVVLSVPFLLGGAAVALAFLAEPGRVGRVYAANLLGSGAGAALGLALLAWLPAERLPAAVGLIGLVALAPLARWGALAAPAGLALALLLPPPVIPVSQYKEGQVALELPETRVVAERDGPLGRLTLVAGPTLRYLPGTSLALDQPVPPRPVLYLNGQPLGPRAVAADTALLAMTTAAAAFALPSPRSPRVLILDLGGGSAIWLARANEAAAITVVDPDRRIDDLLAPGTIGPRVERVAADPRGHLHATERRYDRILVSEIGSLHGGASGMAAAGAAYLFTTEGVADLWGALGDDGVLAVTRWALDPPRDMLRLLATVRAVLEDRGLDARRHVALVRGWSTVTLLVSREPLGPDDLAALRNWAEARWFDLTWAPGVSAAEANRFNILSPDLYRIGAEALLGPDPEPFVERYAFRIAPVTDERPFFFHFLTVPGLIELWRSEGRLVLPYFEWGLVVRLLALVQAVPVAAVLILLPLVALPRGAGARRSDAHGTSAASARGGWLFLYFALLGLAFMLLEISAIERLTLFLAQPIYATTVVLAAFLVFAGLGSAAAPRIAAGLDRATGVRAAGRTGPAAGLPILFLAIAALGFLTYAVESALWDHAAGLPLPARMVLAVLLLAPLAFTMGMPFPLGLQRVADRRLAWIPWCWGVNGFLSVIGAAAAPLVALAVGFRGVLALAVAGYLAAGLVFRRL